MCAWSGPGTGLLELNGRLYNIGLDGARSIYQEFGWLQKAKLRRELEEFSCYWHSNSENI